MDQGALRKLVSGTSQYGWGLLEQSRPLPRPLLKRKVGRLEQLLFALCV